MSEKGKQAVEALLVAVKKEIANEAVAQNIDDAGLDRLMKIARAELKALLAGAKYAWARQELVLGKTSASDVAFLVAVACICQVKKGA